MDHEAHVGLINAHAEGVGRHNETGAAIKPRLLIIITVLLRHAAVVFCCPDAGVSKLCVQRVDGPPGQAVYNAALASIFFKKESELGPLVLRPADLVEQVLAVKARRQADGIVKHKGVDYVTFDFDGGSCGEGRDDRPLWEC